VTARIIVDGESAAISFPFDQVLIDLVKTIPGRQWVKAEKVWRIPRINVDWAADALRAAGETVFVTRPDGSAWTSGKSTHGSRGTPHASWAANLLEAVGPELADATYRAMARVLHPDIGGDPRRMQELNDAMDRHRRLRRPA
jgi:hypothetical protein